MCYPIQKYYADVKHVHELNFHIKIISSPTLLLNEVSVLKTLLKSIVMKHSSIYIMQFPSQNMPHTAYSVYSTDSHSKQNFSMIPPQEALGSLVESGRFSGLAITSGLLSASIADPEMTSSIVIYTNILNHKNKVIQQTTTTKVAN